MIKIATLNARSLNSLNKCYYVYDLIKNHQINVLAIQETHLVDEKKVLEIKSIFINYYVYLPILNDCSKGIGFIISNEVEILSFESPNIERLSILSIKFNKKIMNIANIRCTKSCTSFDLIPLIL